MSEYAAPLFDGLDAPSVPYRGRTRQTRAASFTGAVKASVGRRGKCHQLLGLYAVPQTMQDIAAVTGWSIASVCSLTAHLKRHGAIREAGEMVKQWPTGPDTTRTQWQAT